MCPGPSTSERKAFKHMIDRVAVSTLAAQITDVHAGFDHDAFVRRAARGLETLELADRVRHVAAALAATLPADVPEALDILTRSLPPAAEGRDLPINGFRQWPIGAFIAQHGGDHFEASMHAMTELTQRFTSEFAVRPFVERQASATFERLLELTRHPSPHVRRWCSEGTRPRLPWGAKLRALVADPSPIWPILEALKDDPERYVQRSVANNLNDIAKDHPALVVERCAAWSKGADEARAWVIRHGLRTLLKAGDPGALALIGFKPPVKLRATLEVKPQRVSIGGAVELTAFVETEAARSQELMIDYALHLVRKRGTSCKVFKWRTARLPARGSVTLTKKHPMRVTTVRALYPGTHRVELQVNGRRIAEAGFELH